MNWKEFFWEKEIESDIKFDKEMMTVYDLTYILLDFQAVINNMTDIIYNNIKEEYQLVGENSVRNPFYDNVISKERFIKNEIVGKNHPSWQKKIENSFESFLLDRPKIAVSYSPRATVGYKQTTTRRFNKKYRMNLKLNGFSKGSLVLNLTNSLLVSILTEFLKELVFKKTGNQNNINIRCNQYIMIDGDMVSNIPQDSCVRKNIKTQQGSSQSLLDVQKCIHDIVQASKPDENIEESVKRLFKELEKTGIVSELVLYDDRGIKTVNRDVERFAGHFMDVRI